MRMQYNPEGEDLWRFFEGTNGIQWVLCLHLPQSTQKGYSGTTQRPTMGPPTIWVGSGKDNLSSVWLLPKRAKRCETSWLTALMEGQRGSCYVWAWPPSQGMMGEGMWVFTWALCASLQEFALENVPKGCQSGEALQKPLRWTANSERREQPGRTQMQPPSSKNWKGQSTGKKNRVSEGPGEGPCQRGSAENTCHTSRAQSQLTTVPVNKELSSSSRLKASETSTNVWGRRVGHSMPSLDPFLPVEMTEWLELWLPYGTGHSEISVKSVVCSLKQLYDFYYLWAKVLGLAHAFIQ